MCVFVCGYVHVRAGTLETRGHPGAPVPGSWEQADWVLGSEVRSSARAVHDLN